MILFFIYKLVQEFQMKKITLDNIILRVDESLYEAKKVGKNCVL